MIYYVNNGKVGVDVPGGGTVSKPWKTIAYSVGQMIPGDTLVFQDSGLPYTEEFNPSVDGTPGNPYILVGAKGSHVSAEWRFGKRNYWALKNFRFRDHSIVIGDVSRHIDVVDCSFEYTT